MQKTTNNNKLKTTKTTATNKQKNVQSLQCTFVFIWIFDNF